MVVEVRPGEGGDDAKVFASELAGMIDAACRRDGVFVSRRAAGKTLVLELGGRVPGVEDLAGVHRLQRIPSNCKNGRRHTSTVTIAVLEADGWGEVTVDPDDVRVATKRGTGAGGQHRNVTDSAVEVLHRPSGLVVQINSGRSQHQNKERAMQILGERLADKTRGLREAERNAGRRQQIAAAERASKDWTWNTQRGTVLCHHSGATYEIKQFLRGRFGSPAERSAQTSDARV